MSVRTGSLWRLWRRAYATLMAMSVVAIAAGCVTTQWVPLTQAPPKGDKVRLKVEVPSDSAPAATREMTLYYPRMEGDSVLVGTPLPYDSAMSRQERVPAAATLVGLQHVNVGGTVGIALAGLLVLGVIVGVAAIRRGLGPRYPSY